MDSREFFRGVRASLPTAVGYVSIGLACGVVGSSSGLTTWEMGLMSLLIYAGSSQFAFAALVLANASLVTLTLTIFLINLRHLLMSLHVTTIFKKVSLVQGIGIGTLLTDESYGVLLNEQAHQKTISTSWMHGNNIMAYLSWVLAVVCGALVGSYIPNPVSLGLDFALVAMFVSIFASQLTGMLRWLGGQKIAMILGAVAVSYLLLTIVLSDSMAVLVATLAGCAVGVRIDDN
ncbi:AzlC family ABC transporter permease [Streptococcus halotolerans]|uniref:AzlC family ABC transporter permease n=1 Tax=Streptococcus halotolerans TaxID=1814128 RepID=UPI0007873899|nr:AzlC family ABC transporter permease [Streptococcus halotolerans]